MLGCLLVLALLGGTPLASNAPNIQVKPLLSMDLSVHGPTALLVTGDLAKMAATVLSNVEQSSGSLAPASGIVTISERPDHALTFVVPQASRGSNAVHVLTTSAGQITNVSDDGTGSVVAKVPVSYLRAIAATASFFQSQSIASNPSDRDIAHYDILVFMNAGQYHVNLIHRRAGIVTYAGCYDGSGYDGAYLVDPSTMSVAAARQPC